MEQQERNWYYLLPTGERAGDMKEACEILERNTGHFWSSQSFRTLVKKNVVKKMKKSTNCIASESNANDNNTGANLNR
jgi:hypothetical protein